MTQKPCLSRTDHKSSLLSTACSDELKCMAYFVLIRRGDNTKMAIGAGEWQTLNKMLTAHLYFIQLQESHKALYNSSYSPLKASILVSQYTLTEKELSIILKHASERLYRMQVFPFSKITRICFRWWVRLYHYDHNRGLAFRRKAPHCSKGFKTEHVLRRKIKHFSLSCFTYCE